MDAPHAGTPAAADPPAHARTRSRGIELVEAKPTEVGALTVHRVLPRRARRTVGPWCFADHFGPVHVADASMRVGPHPHIGLQTVTWLLAGEVVHTDSLGVEQAVRPGQLNLMTAGRGVAHAERTPTGSTGRLHGIQLWMAQPDATRHRGPAFEHHPDLPTAGLPGAVARVLVGRMTDVESPARADWPTVGIDLTLHGRARLPLDPAFEHALLATDGALVVDGTTIPAGALGYVAPGHEQVTVEAATGHRALLLGGAPFESPLLMWWNFVARHPDELADARADWEAGNDRFGAVRSPLDRVPAPPASGVAR
jgi:redox-sensitive bicupin YhaK (pirin superfamily)